MSRLRTRLLTVCIASIATIGCRTAKPPPIEPAAAVTDDHGVVHGSVHRHGDADLRRQASDQPQPDHQPSSTHQPSPQQTTSLDTAANTGQAVGSVNDAGAPSTHPASHEPATEPFPSTSNANAPSPADSQVEQHSPTLPDLPTHPSTQTNIAVRAGIPGTHHDATSPTAQHGNFPGADAAAHQPATSARSTPRPVYAPSIAPPRPSNDNPARVATVKLPLSAAPAGASNSVAVSTGLNVPAQPERTPRPSPIKLWGQNGTASSARSTPSTGTSLSATPSTAPASSASASSAPVPGILSDALTKRHASDNVPTVSPLIETPPNNHEWIAYQQAAKQAEQDARMKELETLRRVFYRVIFRDPVDQPAP